MLYVLNWSQRWIHSTGMADFLRMVRHMQFGILGVQQWARCNNIVWWGGTTWVVRVMMGKKWGGCKLYNNGGGYDILPLTHRCADYGQPARCQNEIFCLPPSTQIHSMPSLASSWCCWHGSDRFLLLDSPPSSPLLLSYLTSMICRCGLKFW